MTSNSKKEVRVRFAPSPTGPFSIGNARTALFNWLYARHRKGKFLLRIEDTDEKRSKKEYEELILDGLNWLDFDWDEEVVHQSERKEIYKKYLKKLVDEGKAFRCFCSEEELEADKEAKLSQGLPPTYSGRCRNLSDEEVKKRIKDGEDYVIRFRMPGAKISFRDLVRGKVEFNGELIGDFIIAKDFENPLYNFAVVVDDEAMDVSHVIRGEDHISNTPKQIAIQKALGFNEVKYAHLPLILAPGGKKLSKRDLKKSLMDYKSEGYIPEAMFNFLALMGWHPKEDRELVSREEAIDEFSLKRVQKSGAGYDETKLEWYNSHYIQNLPAEKIVSYLSDFIPSTWGDKPKLLKKAVEAEQERMKRLTDFKELADFFFELPDYNADMLIWKENRAESMKSLKKVYNFVKNLNEDEFNKEKVEKFLLDLSDEFGGKGEVFWPFRVALSGKKASPGGLDILEVLGKDESERSLKKAVEKSEGLHMLD